MITKSIRTTILIDNDLAPKDDWGWINRKNFKPTNLLRAKIKELREQEEGKPDADTLLKTINNLQNLISTYVNFLEKKGLVDDFINDK